MRLRHTNVLFCDGCFHRIKDNEDTYLVERVEDNKIMQICVRCLN